MKERIQKLDNVFAGVLVGGILPIFGFLISYMIKGMPTDLSFTQYVNIAMYDNGFGDQQDILILSVIPNMLLFYFSNFRWAIYEFTKGLVGVTLVLGLGLIIIAY